MNKKQLEELKERFILPTPKHEIIERVKLCLRNGIKIIRDDYNKKPVRVYFEKNFSKKKREHWEEYAMTTYLLVKNLEDSPKN